MTDTLRSFVDSSLFDATSSLLAKLRIKFDRETAEPVSLSDFYDGPMPQSLVESYHSVDKAFFIGIINDRSLQGLKSNDSLESVENTIRRGGKYDGMFVFACDIKMDAKTTRTTLATLTRAFNRISSANPVILVFRQGSNLSLATCERMEYNQSWRQGTGEKLGKVTILRNINCEHPHRGHIDILESLGNEAFATFDGLYQHWMEVFSSELLTKKFYGELSDWYAWAVQVAKFPNDLRTNDDDEKYNHESCIRLITRLIFVWFLKQKHLIPEEFFDEGYIRQNLIENFNPHDRKNLLYNPERSQYYRLILQNLFFAMLNCPIVAEGKEKPNNRRFRQNVRPTGLINDDDPNNLMRYESEFMAGGADKFAKLANTSVPFLNGGLFDCLDSNETMMFYDGFSENQNSLRQLYLPDWLFFGEEMGTGIDLSQWYDDVKKRNVSARGLIDILKRYSFTIEENTPLDQEVSLDPELLGKVFENLLAAFNPETKTSARKQTGSFYTPREIVQYMVNESLTAHLIHRCGKDDEETYRSLLSYSDTELNLPIERRRKILDALYGCKVLDPACGSGAFPMGVLQQMVHILQKIDPTNEMWNDLMIDVALEETKRELKKVAGNKLEQQKAEENKKTRLDDIEKAFNQNINDPDYARKLFLIERCIYGVDIQPIATQISKLRFFITLVADQKPTKDPKSNFGIRPLPNLEAKFVTANTLIPLDREQNIFTASEEIHEYEEQLQEINHRIFLAKRNKDKEHYRELMNSTRTMMAQALENKGFISTKGFYQLVQWKMFDQNSSAPFFDTEWMFGITDGFDVVIGNPPYVLLQTLNDREAEIEYKKYEVASYKIDLFHLFFERGIQILTDDGVLAYITPNTYLTNKYIKPLRSYILKKCDVKQLVLHDKVFENASVDNATIFLSKSKQKDNTVDIVYCTKLIFNKAYCIKQSLWENDSENLFNVRKNEGVSFNNTIALSSICSSYFGIQAYDKKSSTNNKQLNDEWLPIIDGADIHPFSYSVASNYFHYKEDEIKSGGQYKYYSNERIVVRQIGNIPVVGLCDGGILGSNTLYNLNLINPSYRLKFVYGVLNSNVIKYYWKVKNSDNKALFPKIKGYQLKDIPIAQASVQNQLRVEKLVDALIKNNNNEKALTDLNDLIYHLYGLSYDEVMIIDPETPIAREEYESFII